MTKKEIVEGFMNRFDYYKDLIKNYPEYTGDWCDQLGEVFAVAMWIGAISIEQYGTLSEMLLKVRFGEE